MFLSSVFWNFPHFPSELELPEPSGSQPLTHATGLLQYTDGWIALQRGWEVRDGRVYFPVEDSEKEVLASGTIIENTIGYAHELETIV